MKLMNMVVAAVLAVLAFSLSIVQSILYSTLWYSGVKKQAPVGL